MIAVRITPWWGVLAVTVGALLTAPTAKAEVFRIGVHCWEKDGMCMEECSPNPAVISVGDSVDWAFSPSCELDPCGPICTIDIPPQGSFPGYHEEVLVPGPSPPTPGFNEPGEYTYTLECSPQGVFTIIVRPNGIPTTTVWGLITLMALLVAAGVAIIVRRRRAAHA